EGPAGLFHGFVDLGRGHGSLLGAAGDALGVGLEERAPAVGLLAQFVGEDVAGVGPAVAVERGADLAERLGEVVDGALALVAVGEIELGGAEAAELLALGEDVADEGPALEDAAEGFAGVGAASGLDGACGLGLVAFDLV